MLAGNMYISTTTGTISHYKYGDNSTLIHQFQLKDENSDNTNSVGLSYARQSV